MPGDSVVLHHGGGGFRVDRDDERYVPALEKLIRRDVVGQIEIEINRARDALAGLAGPEHLQVFFVLGNPDDEHLMTVTGGYYGMGGTPGWLYLIGWPSEEVVDRIAHCAVHEFHHQMRYHNVEWNPVSVTVGEHVIAEGLAEAFVRELSGPEAMGPWSSMVTGADYDRALARITADAGLAGMQHTSAYVLGDTTARRFGQEPRGIPDMAGYAVGLHLVDKHLEATGLSVAQSSALPGAEILRNAGVAISRLPRASLELIREFDDHRVEDGLDQV